jgi:hypothetical protein
MAASAGENGTARVNAGAKGQRMNQFRQVTEQLLMRDAAIVAFVGFGAMMAYGFEPTAAFMAAGIVSLLFCLGLILRAWWLTEERVPELEAWRHVEPDQRPIGDDGLRKARDQFQLVLLHAAKISATFAISFCGAALALDVAG